MMTSIQQLEQNKKLVKCWMVNANGEGRHRFVELENFRLWEYLVTNKHNMTISDITVCLWVSDNNFQSNRAMFEHAAGVIFRVDQVTIERYDPNYKFFNLIHRYCLSEETTDLQARLKSLIVDQGAKAGDWKMLVTEGWGLEPEIDELVEPIALGIA